MNEKPLAASIVLLAALVTPAWALGAAPVSPSVGPTPGVGSAAEITLALPDAAALTFDEAAQRPAMAYYREPACLVFPDGSICMPALCGDGTSYQANILGGHDWTEFTLLQAPRGADDAGLAAATRHLNAAFDALGGPLMDEARAAFAAPTLELTVFVSDAGLELGYDVPNRQADLSILAKPLALQPRVDATLFTPPAATGNPWVDAPELAALGEAMNAQFAVAQSLAGAKLDVAVDHGGLHLVRA